MISRRRPTIRIPSFDLQKLVQEFTLASRFWTGYPIDKVEHMMRFYGVLPKNFYYAGFDADKEEAIFQCQPDEYEWNDLSIEAQRLEINVKCPRLPTGAKLLMSGS